MPMQITVATTPADQMTESLVAEIAEAVKTTVGEHGVLIGLPRTEGLDACTARHLYRAGALRGGPQMIVISGSEVLALFVVARGGALSRETSEMVDRLACAGCRCRVVSSLADAVVALEWSGLAVPTGIE